MSDTPPAAAVVFDDPLPLAPSLESLASPVPSERAPSRVAPSRLGPGSAIADTTADDDFDAEPLWRGQPIEPFGFGAQSLARRLMQCSVPIPAPAYGNDLDAHILDAAIVLYLCLHKREHYRPLRGDPVLFIESIEAWAEEHLPRSQWLEAITFVFSLWDRQRRSETVAPRTPGGRAGNV